MMINSARNEYESLRALILILGTEKAQQAARTHLINLFIHEALR
jgi:hypothetical protein